MSRLWLTRRGVPAAAQATVVADVEDRLADLPTALRWGASAADQALAVLPARVQRAALRLPGVSEWARMVTSLTAVAYFDLNGAVSLPTQRATTERVGLDA